MKRGSEWSSVYMLIVVIIAAVLVLTLVKPMFRQAAETTRQNAGMASDLVRAALFG